MAHTYARLLTHVVFSTKNRVACLDAELKPTLFSYMGGIIRELRGNAIDVNGTADHVHLLVVLPPTVAISDALRVLKTDSSRWIHETWRDRARFAWQTGYGAFSVSQLKVDAVRRYIDGQEDHHRRVTFQEEFLTLLKRHEIPYDERYIWE